MSIVEVRVSDGPTVEEWIVMRPIFLQLYKTKPLNQVRRELAEKYSFTPTEKACKRRIKMWQAHKYYKASEKGQVARHEILLREAGMDLKQLNIRGEPIDWNRVRRHQRKRAKEKYKICATSELPQEVVNCDSPPTGFQNQAELLLGAVKQFIESQITTLVAERCPHTSWIDWALSRRISAAVTLLSIPQQSQLGWKMIHQSCDTLLHMVVTEPLSVWKFISSLFQVRWNAFNEVRVQLFLFIRNWCCQRLPQGNPFRTVMQYSASVEFLQNTIGQLLSLEIDISCRFSVPGENAYALASSGVMDLVRHEQFDAAQQSLIHMTRVMSMSAWAGVDAIYLSALILYKNREHQAAISKCQLGLALIDTHSTVTRLIYTKSLFHDVLGACYQAMGENYHRLHHRRLAFDVALEYFQEENADVIVTGVESVEFLKEWHRWSDLALEKSNYRRSCFLAEYDSSSFASI